MQKRCARSYSDAFFKTLDHAHRSMPENKEQIEIRASELVFAGDEKKDIECAHNAGTKGILINRTDEDKDFGQDHTINDLSGLLSLL